MTRGMPFRYTVVVSSYRLQYFALYTPLFDRRLAITLGHAMPTPDEIAASEAQSLRYAPTHTALPPVSPSTTPSVKHDLITNRDAEALKHLMDIHMSYLTEGRGGDAAGVLGFKLAFYFSSNSFFTNDVLTKTYVYWDELRYEGDIVYNHTLGCEIKWKEDKDLTKSLRLRSSETRVCDPKSVSALPAALLTPS